MVIVEFPNCFQSWSFVAVTSLKKADITGDFNIVLALNFPDLIIVP